MSAVIQFRAPSSGLDRSSPRFPLPASGPSAEIRAGYWRTRLRALVAGHFFPEEKAQERTLRGPSLPHQRHPITADELLAGFLTALVCGASLIFYLIWRFV